MTYKVQQQRYDFREGRLTPFNRDVDIAIQDALFMDHQPPSCGSNKPLEQRLENVGIVLSRLLTRMVNSGRMSPAEIKEILGPACDLEGEFVQED